VIRVTVALPMQLTPTVHDLRIPFIVPIGNGAGIERFVNCYLILADETWVIDTGVKGSSGAIIQKVSELGRSEQSIRHILLTHSHVDHIGGARELVERTGAKIYAHPAERSWIEHVELQAEQRPVPGFFDLVGGSVALNHELEDGQVLTLAPDLHLRVLHVPGHSSGSCAFFLEEPKLLFCGDAVPLPNDMPVYDDPVQSARSLAKLRQVRMIQTLASAWDDVRHGAEIDRVLETSSQFLEAVHSAVLEQSLHAGEVDELSFCRAVLGRVGLPEAMANLMVLRTIRGHLKHRYASSLVV
jgi:glyoxylase-like metal-dependent hydrolase (beta-lactamase superfamily II)